MTAAHQRSVPGRFPEAAGKVWMPSEAAEGAEPDVADALGAAMATYERLVGQLDAPVAEALDKPGTA